MGMFYFIHLLRGVLRQKLFLKGPSKSKGSSNSKSNCIFRIVIDLLAILLKSLDGALFLYIFMHEVRSSGVRN